MPLEVLKIKVIVEWGLKKREEECPGLST